MSSRIPKAYINKYENVVGALIKNKDYITSSAVCAGFGIYPVKKTPVKKGRTNIDTKI